VQGLGEPVGVGAGVGDGGEAPGRHGDGKRVRHALDSASWTASSASPCRLCPWPHTDRPVLHAGSLECLPAPMNAR
jgi:hypothetical protein